MIELTMVADNYPHILPLKDGRVSSDLVKLKFVEYKRVADAFDTQVENQTYDICEIAAATFFQALDFKKPLRLLPFVCLGSFHHRSVWYDPDRGVVTPEDLRGARVAVKAYTQTTGKTTGVHYAYNICIVYSIISALNKLIAGYLRQVKTSE